MAATEGISAQEWCYVGPNGKRVGLGHMAILRDARIEMIKEAKQDLKKG